MLFRSLGVLGRKRGFPGCGKNETARLRACCRAVEHTQSLSLYVIFDRLHDLLEDCNDREDRLMDAMMANRRRMLRRMLVPQRWRCGRPREAKRR